MTIEGEILAELRDDIKEIRKNQENTWRVLTGVDTTVQLIVQGKMKIGNTNYKGIDNNKVVLGLIEIIRLAIAGLVGFIAGGGWNI